MILLINSFNRNHLTQEHPFSNRSLLPHQNPVTLQQRSAAAVKTEQCDRTETKYGGLVGEKVKEEKLEMTDMDTGMEGK